MLFKLTFLNYKNQAILRLRCINKIIIFLVLFVFLFSIEYAHSTDCSKDKLDFYGEDIEISNHVISYRGTAFKSLDEALNSLADNSRDCPLLIIPSKDQKDITLGKDFCSKVAEMGFKNVSLSDPNRKGWTLYSLGISCSY